MELIAFKSKQVKEILKLIGEDTTKETFGDCETCKEVLRLENIGFIARGDNKNLLFCDNPACFSPMVAKSFPKSEKEEHSKDCKGCPDCPGEYVCKCGYTSKELDTDHKCRSQEKSEGCGKMYKQEIKTMGDSYYEDFICGKRYSEAIMLCGDCVKLELSEQEKKDG